jgi:hypothetical protein
MDSRQWANAIGIFMIVGLMSWVTFSAWGQNVPQTTTPTPFYLTGCPFIPNPPIYAATDPALLATRSDECWFLVTAGGPTEVAAFLTEEATLEARYAGTAQAILSATPTPYYLSGCPYMPSTPIYAATNPALMATRADECWFLVTAGGTQVVLFKTHEAVLNTVIASTLLPLTITQSPIPTYTPTPTPAITLSPTIPGSTSYSACAWQWVTQPLPELTTQAQELLQLLAYTDLTISASAYGENCWRQDTNQIAYFAAMTTDFDVTAPSLNLADRAAIGNLYTSLAAALQVLDTDTTPPNLGYLTLVVGSGPDQVVLHAMFNEIQRLVEQGIDGAALVDAILNA